MAAVKPNYALVTSVSVAPVISPHAANVKAIGFKYRVVPLLSAAQDKENTS